MKEQGLALAARLMGRDRTDAAAATRRIALLKKGRRASAAVLYYVVLLSLSFVFLYPLLFMASRSLMQPQDVADATVQWIPRSLDFSNYGLVLEAIHYLPGFANSAIISFGSAALQIVSCSFVGYGFARFRFPGRGIWLALVVFTFLVPPQTIVVPLFIFFSDLNWINTHLPFVVPSLFGHGLKGALFVLIFIQFYRRLPSVLEEAARIDGAGAFRTYAQIMFPLARPAMLVVFLFSVVWHWNDTFEPNTYLLVPEFFNLSQNLTAFNGLATQNMNQSAQSAISTGAIGAAPTLMNQIMAGVMLTIAPILLLYLFVQKYFVESIERAGIAGE
ncbi:N-Acetyl-D-glucosamine ABC transport system, permease protein 2 [Paenibacillus pasadenensis]|uniref:N-Acetyl-D-glucosamine ABC transport system, permease protein 2 n=1 Tax=Paenibacillus pasadenensis TaxID=217090 RepID=A0A2N5N812_9BACL|nr:carbohydrate ABC transporter permease [Paenibacillus pasadenensis]PLT46468.1 N-Acetyl-D-glucosamine ABC transport system, permease protein 2 [Paenibacillus pasadenensis]